MRAYCWANGVIEFGRTVPEGAIQIARGRERDLKREIEPTSRLAYDSKTLLVPGVPEAENQESAVDALLAHIDWLASRKGTGVTWTKSKQ